MWCDNQHGSSGRSVAWRQDVRGYHRFFFFLYGGVADMTDADRTSTQVEEQEQTNGEGGLLNKIVESTKNLVETVTETAKEVVGTVAENAPAAVSSVLDRVRGDDESSKQASTNAAEDGGTDTPEARPVAVAESVSGNEETAAPQNGTEESTVTPQNGAEESPVEQVADTVRERASAVVEALTTDDEAPSTGSTTGDVVEAVRRRVSRVYGAITGATPETTTTAPSEGATYQPTAEEGTKPGRPRRFKDVQAGMQLQGKVTSIALYGIFVDVGVGRDGLVHISEMSERRIDTPTDLVEIGQPVDVWVKSVDPDARRISLTMRDPNRPKPERSERRGGPRKREINRERLAELHVGDSVEGTISSLSNFGAFVDIGVGKDGLVHVSELAEGRVERAEDVVKVGEAHTFKILEIDPEGNRISLSLRRAQRAQRMQQLEPGTIMDGTISGIAPFGAFVDVGVGRDGLIHISELGAERVNSVEEAVKVGDKVQVRVIEVDPNSKRISLTMRVDEPLPKERERPAPRASNFGGGDRTFSPSPATGPSYGSTPSYGALPPMEESGSSRGGRRGGRDSGREGGRDFGGRGEGRAGAAPRRDRGGERGGGRSGGGRGRGEGRSERYAEGYEAAEEVYTVEDPEEESFSGDATLEDLLTKFNSGKGRDRRASRDEDDENEGDRRADAIRRTLALRDEE
jgi:small subunit ribosomal protein S1